MFSGMGQKERKKGSSQQKGILCESEEKQKDMQAKNWRHSKMSVERERKKKQTRESTCRE